MHLTYYSNTYPFIPLSLVTPSPRSPPNAASHPQAMQHNSFHYVRNSPQTPIPPNAATYKRNSKIKACLVSIYAYPSIISNASSSFLIHLFSRVVRIMTILCPHSAAVFFVSNSAAELSLPLFVLAYLNTVFDLLTALHFLSYSAVSLHSLLLQQAMILSYGASRVLVPYSSPSANCHLSLSLFAESEAVVRLYSSAGKGSTHFHLAEELRLFDVVSHSLP